MQSSRDSCSWFSPEASHLSLHQGFFKGEGVVIDAPQDVAVLRLRSSHQEDTFKTQYEQSQVEHILAPLDTEVRRRSPTFAVQRFMDLCRFLQCGGRTKPRRESNMDQSEQTGPSSWVPLVLGGERRGGEVETHTCKQIETWLTAVTLPCKLGSRSLKTWGSFTCVSHRQQVTVGRLKLVDDRNVNNGCEDGTIKRPAEGGGFYKDVQSGW